MKKHCFIPIIALVNSIFLGTNFIGTAIASCNDYSDNNVTSPMLSLENQKITFAKDFLESYYLSKDLYYDCDFSQYISNSNFLKYVDEKAKSSAYKLQVYDVDDKQNYKLDLECVESYNISDATYYKFNVNILFNYKNCDVLSGYGEQNFIKVEADDLGVTKISDWYIPYDEYDVFVRGELSSLPRESVWEREESQELLKKQKNENMRLKNYYAQAAKNQKLDFSYNTSEKSAEQPLAASASLHSLNKHNIVVWATNNYNKKNPTSGNPSQVSSYYDFSTIPNNFDCTNFVSHAILAGGAPVYDTGYSGIQGSGWYFRNISNRSSSWSGVNNLYSFLTTNTTRGPKATSIAYSNYWAPSGTPRPYDYGDLIQFHSGTTWIHSGVITTMIPLSGSSTTIEAGVTYRSSSSSYSLNKRQSEIYSGKSRRVLVLDGYYS